VSDLELHFYKVIMTGSASLIVAYLAAKFALYSFFKQKEYELVRDRYLTEGVDKVRAYNIKVMTDYNWNYLQTSKCLAKAYHAESAFDPERTLSTLRAIDDINVSGLEYTRVSRLLNDESLWELNDFIIGNILAENEHLIRILETLKHAESMSPNAILKLKDEIEGNQNKMHVQIGCITSFLTEITDVLEESNLEFSAVKNFYMDTTVAVMLGNIRALWHTEKPKT
jgi:hypothetical protein